MSEVVTIGMITTTQPAGKERSCGNLLRTLPYKGQLPFVWENEYFTPSTGTLNRNATNAVSTHR